MSQAKKYIIGGVAAVALAGAAYFSFGGANNTSGESTDKTVTVGIMSGSKEDDQIWNVISQNAKDDYGVTIEFKKFTDYSQPNKALADGEVDVNAFQHYAFLNDWNKANDTDLVAIGDTQISPIRLYSQQVTSVDDIQDGATIVVPNDTTNETRALYVLKNAGLIDLDSGLTTATIKDIKGNDKNLKIKEVDAAQTARSLGDVAAAVINGNYAATAGLTKDDAIFTEPVNKDSQRWINIIAARNEDKDKQVLKDLVKAYQQDNVKEAIKEAYPDGNSIPAWDIELK
jgi:D-methionine transport system substrate-binding protein